MAVIKVTCSDCGDVEVQHCDMWVRLCADTMVAVYYFRCSSCRMVEHHSAEPSVVQLLSDAGVKVECWYLLLELKERHEGEPISHDDVLRFYEELADDDHVAISLANLEAFNV